MERHEAILKAAAELISERGFAAMSVDELGERAGVTGPAIYRHFRSKSDILAALFDEALDQLLAHVPEATDPAERLRDIVAAHADFVLRERELCVVWANEIRALPKIARRRLRRRTQTYIDRWRHAVEACWPGRPREDLESSVLAALALVNSMTGWPAPLRAREGAAELATRMALAALAEGVARPAALSSRA